MPIEIRSMQPPDLRFAAACTAAEGWVTETLAEIEGFFAYCQEGCLIAEVDGMPAGITIATPYGKCGFIGEVIVAAAQRGRGLGRRLVDAGVAFLHARGIENIYLDGVPLAVELYRRAGFRKICISKRLFIQERLPSPAGLARPMLESDLPAVFELDREAFGDDRSFYLRRRWELYPELSKVMERNGVLLGYILGRLRPPVATAGPWIARTDNSHPEELLLSLAAEAGRMPLSIGVLETNTTSLGRLRALGFEQRADPPTRMVMGNWEGLGGSAMCLANGTAAKG